MSRNCRHISVTVQANRQEEVLEKLDELSVGRAGFDGRLGVGRAVGWVGRARTGSSGPGGRIGQAATCSRSEIRLAPLSASNRCSLV